MKFCTRIPGLAVGPAVVTGHSSGLLLKHCNKMKNIRKLENGNKTHHTFSTKEGNSKKQAAIHFLF